MKSIKLVDQIQTKNLLDKVDRLCQLHKCSVVDLIVLSIDVHANKKIKNIKESKNGKSSNN